MLTNDNGADNGAGNTPGTGANSDADRTTDPDVVELDAQAVGLSLDLAETIRPEDLDRPTPCVGWTLYGLLAHMTAQNEGFAAAYHGDGDLDRWKWVVTNTDPVAAHRSSAERVLAAFATRELDRMMPMPEFGADLTIPAHQAIGMHLVDYVVHSWDLARTLDRPLQVEGPLLDRAWEIARMVPDGQTRVAPGAPFGPPVPWSDEPTLDGLVAFLGRSPRWPAAA
ncbi:TIGR03086 family protein [Actinobacteria bacterium YIM 96077]|uniref:TIGR03086 family protein n=1 Tax=Phytoactinopolyspora halophila TaxID=1981511 RepID=A0A329QGM7_9ACTN|nr:TIGR03086 family metal-binding protein [Phytoactinopolyspora halophila]AYY13089.1 TIGR03086 family protein [Actinobacteria bacterium YIM 96077]RAW11101.1 TIGR03086 family protein [Phytoactinopolyspora halophila]